MSRGTAAAAAAADDPPDAAAAVGAARGRVVSSMMRKHLVAAVVPVALQLKRQLEEVACMSSLPGFPTFVVFTAVAVNYCRLSSLLRVYFDRSPVLVFCTQARHVLLGDLMMALASLLADYKHEVRWAEMKCPHGTWMSPWYRLAVERCYHGCLPVQSTRCRGCNQSELQCTLSKQEQPRESHTEYREGALLHSLSNHWSILSSWIHQP